MLTAERRKNILWLVSWYPNKTDCFTGDFIQRHAQAAALQNNIHVLFVKDVPDNEVDSYTLQEQYGLTEEIIYYSTPKGKTNIFTKHTRWFQLHVKAIRTYIQLNGKPDLVHVHVPWKAGLIAVWLKWSYGVPYVVTEHWGMYNRVVEDNFFKKPLFVQFLIKRIFKSSNHFISVSQYLSKSIHHWIRKTPVTIIPNVVNTKLFHYATQKHETFTFIHVSNMAPVKNVTGLLRSFKKFIENVPSGAVQLVVIGNTTEEYPLLAAKEGLGKQVLFKGEISYQQVAEEMKLAHCLVLNSFIENSPCVISEAHCCGLPVIATDVGGVPELINKSNGLLVAPNDEAALAKGFLNIFSNYHSFNTLHIAEVAAHKYSYSSIGSQFDAVYNEVVKAVI